MPRDELAAASQLSELELAARRVDGIFFLTTIRNTMAHVKTAIAVPADVLADIDRAARALGESRSKYITRVLRAAVRAKRDAEITHRLNQLFGPDGALTTETADTSFLDQVGTSWSDERW